MVREVAGEVVGIVDGVALAKKFVVLGGSPCSWGGSISTDTHGRVLGKAKTEISRPIVVNCLGIAPASAG